MRIAVEQDGQPTVTLFDLPAGVTIALEAAKRRAEGPSMAARATELENNVPRARVTTTMTVAGAAREIAGVSCQDHRFTIRVPATTDGDQIVVLAGTACVAPAAPFSSKNEASRANGSQVARSPKRLRALNVQGKTAMVEQAEFRLENRCGCCVI